MSCMIRRLWRLRIFHSLQKLKRWFLCLVVATPSPLFSVVATVNIGWENLDITVWTKNQGHLLRFVSAMSNLTGLQEIVENMSSWIFCQWIQFCPKYLSQKFWEETELRGLLKFSFSEKATKICAIVLMDMVLTVNVKTMRENFCGLPRKAELYLCIEITLLNIS